MSECLAGHCDGECQYPTVCSRALQPEIDRLRDELATARLERDNIAALNSSLIAELAEAKARIAELEGRLQRQYAILLEHKSRAERAEAELKVASAALEPFADIASNYAGNRVVSPDTYHVSTTLGDCYRASVAFAPPPAEREG